MLGKKVICGDTEPSSKIVLGDNETKTQWEEICWSHPSSSTPFVESSRGENVEDCTGQSPVKAFALDKDSDNEAILGAVTGCRIVAGTTGGDIRLWSVQDVLKTNLLKIRKIFLLLCLIRILAHGPPMFAVMQGMIGEIKKTRRGRSIGGHRGGVTCLSIPAQIYRPDSLISGGNDGLIKQWSLQHTPSGKSRRTSMGGRTSRMLFSGRENSNKGIG